MVLAYIIILLLVSSTVHVFYTYTITHHDASFVMTLTGTESVSLFVNVEHLVTNSSRLESTLYMCPTIYRKGIMTG